MASVTLKADYDLGSDETTRSHACYISGKSRNQVGFGERTNVQLNDKKEMFYYMKVKATVICTLATEMNC